MSKIIRGIPEDVTQKATIINFEAVKGEYLEEKNRQAQWIQERREQSALKPVDAHSPAITYAFSQLKKKPQLEK